MQCTPREAEARLTGEEWEELWVWYAKVKPEKDKLARMTPDERAVMKANERALKRQKAARGT